jgi:hypothetical protein
LAESGILAADGLESFLLSQYFPNNINVLVGKKSQYIYSSSFYYFRRKGRMTDDQYRKREILYKTARFEQGGAVRSFMDILYDYKKLIRSIPDQPSILDTDENRIYFSCIHKDPDLRKRKSEGLFQHRRTHSKKKRNYQNKLFAVNYIDREVRKDMAEHTRESVQFARNSNNTMERFIIYSYWHNFMKPFRVNVKNSRFQSHAEAAGFSEEKIKHVMDSVFRDRCFYSLFKKKLSPFLRTLWERKLVNPISQGHSLMPQYALR